MISGARYVHTNLIARDWQALARFYQAHFGCVPVLPERNYAGRDLEVGTGVPGASLCGVHLRLPGVDAKGPTLEIFTYSRLADGAAPAANRPGFAHIAFEVTSVRAQPATKSSAQAAKRLAMLSRSKPRQAPE